MFTDELKNMYDANPTYANTLAAGKLPKGGTANDDALAKAFLTKVNALGATAKKSECGNINENFDDARRSISIENTHIFSDNFLLSSGYEYQNNFVESKTQINGRISQANHTLHTTAHYQLSDSLGLSTGGNYYSTSMRDQSDGKFSYHFGLNFDYASNQTAKLIYSKTHRSPDPYELYSYWSYYMTDFSIPFDNKTGGLFYRTTQNYGAPVSSERYKTLEADFSGSLFNKHFEYDFKLFKENMDGLVSQDLIFTSYAPTNSSFTELKGAEFLVRYRFSAPFYITIGGTSINNDSTNLNEKSLYAKSSGYITAIYTGINNDFSAAYFSQDGVFDNSFDRLEATITHRFTGSLADVSLKLKATYQPSDYVASLGQINASGTARDGTVTTMYYSHPTSLTATLLLSF